MFKNASALLVNAKTHHLYGMSGHRLFIFPSFLDDVPTLSVHTRLEAEETKTEQEGDFPDTLGN